MSGIDGSLLPYCYLLSDMLGKVDAGKYTYQQLSTLGIKYTGGVTFQVHAYSAAESVNDYTVKFTVTAKALVHNLTHMFDILRAIALESRFDSVKRCVKYWRRLKATGTATSSAVGRPWHAHA